MNENPEQFKSGDWVHTENGFGLVVHVHPHYYQYWESLEDRRYRNDVYGGESALAERLLGPVKEVGDWVMDVLYVKRLCDHDLKPYSRMGCFETRAYPNNRVTKKEMAKIQKILKDPKVAARFQKYECQLPTYRYAWRILISPETATEVQHALSEMNANLAGRLRLTMREVASWFRQSFDVDVFESYSSKLFNNAVIDTVCLPISDAGHYNEAREQVFCKIDIRKQLYDEKQLAGLISAQNLDPRFYDESEWAKAGWGGRQPKGPSSK